VKIYTRSGDDGTTGLFCGGRVRKDGTGPEAYGSVDEAVSALGSARAEAHGPLADRILTVQRELFAVGAELATDASNRDKLKDGVSRVTDDMVARLEADIDEVVEAISKIRGAVDELCAADHPLVRITVGLHRRCFRP
jgi:cob(I)alamin adenosyltransferase